MSSSPTGVDGSLSSQASLFVGINLNEILYGIELCFYLKTMLVLAPRRRTPHKSDIFYASFSTVTFILITLWVTINGIFGQQQWIRPHYPGQGIVYLGKQWSMAIVTTLTIILQQMSNGLMMYRCQTMWNNTHVIILPSILWLATLALGLVAIWASSTAQTNFLTGTAAKFSLAYYSTAILLNTILTGMICFQRVSRGRVVKREFGAEYAAPYFSVPILLVESLLPLTLIGVAFLVSFGVASPAKIALWHVYVLTLCLSPQMLISHVAQGDTWQKETTKPISVIKFSPGHANTLSTGCFVESGVASHLESLAGGSTSDPGKDEKVAYQS